MLLQARADPNLKVYNDEFDRNSQLRPVLVEYLASNEHPSLEVVQLLLRYGSKVSLSKTIKINKNEGSTVKSHDNQRKFRIH